MEKAIGPILDVNIGAKKFVTDTVSNSTLGLFKKAKLITVFESQWGKQTVYHHFVKTVLENLIYHQ